MKKDKINKISQNENLQFVNAVMNEKNVKANHMLEKILAHKVARRIKQTLG